MRVMVVNVCYWVDGGSWFSTINTGLMTNAAMNLPLAFGCKVVPP